MDDFPKMLYRQPGTERVHTGLFATRIVATEDEALAADAEGWHETMEGAIAAREAEKAEVLVGVASEPPPAGESGPATRQELEQKATELGIAFSPRMSDRKLGEAIAAKLAEKV